MKQLQKPIFWGAVMWWENPDYFPKDLATRLAGVLARAKSLTADDRKKFLTKCASHSQARSMAGPLRSTAKTKGELEQLAASARALLQKLGNMSNAAKGTFNAHHTELMSVAKPNRALHARLSPTEAMRGAAFLSLLWDQVQDLENTLRYTADKVDVNRQTKPKQNQARALVFDIAGEFKLIAGKAPPYSKNSWFVEFMEVLCEWDGLALPCGHELIGAVMKGRFKPV